jgi:anti-anti-sigma factor
VHHKESPAVNQRSGSRRRGRWELFGALALDGCGIGARAVQRSLSWGCAAVPSGRAPRSEGGFGLTEFSIEHEAGSREARLSGELDLSVYDEALDHLAWATDSPAEDVVLDLSGVTFMDSTGVRLFVTLRRDLAEEARLVLRSPREQVLKTLELVGAKELGLTVEP